MAIQRSQYSFSLTGQDEIDLVTARSKFKLIDIVRLGIKEALRDCPKVPKELNEKVREIIRKKLG